MIAGPEIARVIEDFGNSYLENNGEVDTHHHDQTASVLTSFAKIVCSLVNLIVELGNPFQEKSQDFLLVLDTKEIADIAALNRVCNQVCNALHVGQDQFDAFTKESLIDRHKSLNYTIHRNKLPLLSTPVSRPYRKKQKLKSLTFNMKIKHVPITLYFRKTSSR